MKNITLAARFEEAGKQRQGLLDRSREMAALTIPSVFTPEETTSNDELPDSYQSLGARGVSNLKSRLLTALFPPSTSWWRLILSQKVENEAAAQGASTDGIELKLAEFQSDINDKLEVSGYRQSMATALEHLAITGNVALYQMPDYNIRVYRLDEYVVRRDHRGKLQWLIIQELVEWGDLAPEEQSGAGLLDNEIETAKEAGLKLYTEIRRDGDGWKLTQEINKNTVKEGSFKVNPYHVLRWKEVAGENYGRGIVEENLPDLRTFDGLSQAILDASISAARILWLTDPNGLTKIKDIVKAENGAAIYGRRKDCEALQLDKFADLQVAQAEKQNIERRLGKAFLLESETQPTGERVTATQIRRIALELEGALGGVFTSLSREIQRPFIERHIYQMQRDNLIPAELLEEDLVQTVILTGLEALGYEIELQKMLALVSTLGQIPEAFRYLKLSAVVKRIIINSQVDPAGLVKSDEEVQAEVDAEQQAALAQQAQSTAVNTAGKVAEAAGSNLVQPSPQQAA